MVFAVFFLSISGACAWLAAAHGGPWWLLAWPAAAYATLGVAYAGAGPRVFGKRPDGTLPLPPTCLLAPYLVPIRVLWWLLRARNDPQPFVELVPGSLFVGRRLRRHEFPAGLACVVDLTCEFENESRGTRYVSLPILDGYVPTPQALQELVQLINGVDGPVYLHCAEGRGRAALVACAVLLSRGLATDVADAVAQVRARRLIILSGAQRALLRRTYDR